jgi:hypothetical protein
LCIWTLPGKFFGFGNVSGLAGFITHCQQQHDVFARTGEIDPVAWSDVPTQFQHTTPNTSDVTPVPGGDLLEVKNDSSFGVMVFQPSQPAAEGGWLL